jgi:ATP-dependent Clp protease protease subunit
MKTNHLEIANRRGKLKLNDGVHKDSADRLIEELDRLYGPAAVAAQMRIGDVVCSADDALESVEVEINSPGGSVFEGQRIYSALREMSSRGVEIVTTVNGLAASMGSVILMAGDTRRMTKESRIMIHEASSIAMGDSRAMRKTADLLEGISADIAAIYADRTGGEIDVIRDLMRAETWLDSDAAQDAGFVSEVIDYAKKDKKAKAEFDTGEKAMSILSRLFPGNDEVEKLEAALADADTLRADLESAQNRIAELAPLAEVNAKLQADLTAATEQLETAKATITELEAKAEISQEVIGKRAAELLAAQGHPKPVAVAGDNGESKSVLEKFNELTGVEAATFYAKHKAEIIALASKGGK